MVKAPAEFWHSPELPHVPEEVAELFEATKAWLFDDQPSDLIHPKVMEDSAFVALRNSPTEVMTDEERNVLVSDALLYSFVEVTRDALTDPVSKVSNPQAYVALYALGKKTQKQKGRHWEASPMTMTDEEYGEPAIAAAAAVTHIDEIIGQGHISKRKTLRKLKDVEPKLVDGEIYEYDRLAARQRRQELRKLPRKILIAAAIGSATLGFSIVSFLQSKSNERANADDVAGLQSEQDAIYADLDEDTQNAVMVFVEDENARNLLDVPSERLDDAQRAANEIIDIDTELSTLQHESNQSDALFFGLIGLGGLSATCLYNYKRTLLKQQQQHYEEQQAVIFPKNQS